jgi:four helix bundle protein
MATIKRFEDLEVWQLARAFANAVFETYTNNVSFSKDFELKNQINASSGSVMDNIAEGFGRGGRNEFINFLSIAKGSIEESKSQLYTALDRRFIAQQKFDALYNQAEALCKKIGAFMNYLNAATYKGAKFKNRTPNAKHQTPNS